MDQPMGAAAAPMQLDQRSGASSANTPAPSRPRARSPPPTRKMLIKPFKVAPKPPDTFANDTLNNLTAAVEAVYQQKHSQFSQEELYRVRQTAHN